MKKFLIPALVLILLLASYAPAYARGGGGAGDVVRLKGEITFIDKDAQTFTLQVKWGSEYVGQEIIVQVTDKTGLYEFTEEGEDCNPIGFGDLTLGDRVGVTGTFVGDYFIARVVIVPLDK